MINVAPKPEGKSPQALKTGRERAGHRAVVSRRSGCQTSGAGSAAEAGGP
jgi:hypothetical protein